MSKAVSWRVSCCSRQLGLASPASPLKQDRDKGKEMRRHQGELRWRGGRTRSRTQSPGPIHSAWTPRVPVATAVNKLPRCEGLGQRLLCHTGPEGRGCRSNSARWLGLRVSQEGVPKTLGDGCCGLRPGWAGGAPELTPTVGGSLLPEGRRVTREEKPGTRLQPFTPWLGSDGQPADTGPA